MKTQLMLVIMIVVVLFSCEDDQSLENGRIAFAIPVSGNITEPASVIVSVEDENGKSIFQDMILPVTLNGQQYTTEEIQVDRGLYYVTKFIVLSNTTVTYATPRDGSQKATLISEPLPLAFKSSGKLSVLFPTLVGVASLNEPELFGYTNFSYEDMSNPSEEWMDIRVKYELTVGKIYYPAVDVEFIVKAYDENNAEQWSERFTCIGPQTNDLHIKTGFDHYKIEATKWGTSTSQIFIGADLWDARVREGAVPITRVFTKTVNPKKVISYVRSSQQEVDGETKMLPDSKAIFEYDNLGRIKFIEYLSYTSPGCSFIPDKRSEFMYLNDLVGKIRTYEVGTNTTISEDNYTYDAAGKPVRIQHQESGITTTVDLTYLENDRLIRATYRLSNGTSFAYEFVSESGNAKTDRTTRGSQVCSEGVFTYDKYINPLKQLGYVDFLFRNYSNSNRLTEDVNYTGCAFPEFIPDSYQYTYDAGGYPTLAVTHYKGSAFKTQVAYCYE